MTNQHTRAQHTVGHHIPAHQSAPNFTEWVIIRPPRNAGLPPRATTHITPHTRKPCTTMIITYAQCQFLSGIGQMDHAYRPHAPKHYAALIFIAYFCFAREERAKQRAATAGARMGIPTSSVTRISLVSNYYKQNIRSKLNLEGMYL